MENYRSLEEKIAENFTQKYITDQNLDSLTVAKIEYGLSVLIINTLKLVQLYLAAFILGTTLQTLAVHISFLVVRRYSYGYHSSSSMVCSLSGIGLFVIVPRIIMLVSFQLSYTLMFILCIISVLIISLLAPQGTEKNIIKNPKILKVKATLSSATLCFVICMLNDQKVGTMMTYGLLLVASLLVINTILIKKGTRQIC